MAMAFVDARSGATGDMWLGAVVGAGASLERIESAVATLGIGQVRISYGRVRRGGRDASSVRVRAPQQTPRVATAAQVRSLLQYAAVDEPVRDWALQVFEGYARAVATAEDVPEAEVRFAEYSMLDDLAAIVGTCVGLRDLGVERMLAGPVGFAPSHEPSAPARAVALLLADHDVRPTNGDEAVTVAGAAILAELATPVAEPPHLEMITVGAGAAARDVRGAGLLHLTVGREPIGAHDAPTSMPDQRGG